MSYLHPAIEELLTQASNRWRWLLFLQRTAKLATVATAVILLLGIGMVAGWWTSRAVVVTAIVLLIVGVVFAWMVIALMTVIAIGSDRRSWLAAAVERCHAPLLDRLNTLVHLEHSRDKQQLAYAREIALQTQEELIRQPPVLPFSPRHALKHVGVYTAVLLPTILFYGYFHPWRHVSAAESNAAPAPENAPALQIPSIPNQLPETPPEPPWGNVRISQPGRDVRVTPLELVPLQIEAAANRPLKNVEWFTAINGGDEVRHPLETPGDTGYATFHPELSLPEFGAQPWDVVRYYARAATEDGQMYESEAYFIEVVPFREELEQLPGGQRGPEFNRLEQMSSLIQRQNEVIRQTHRQTRLAEQPLENRNKALQQLAEEETRLRQEVTHLAADIASRKETPTTAGPDEDLQQAASTLETARDSLLDDQLETALLNERTALDAMILARKNLQQFVRQPPNNSEQLENQQSEIPAGQDAEPSGQQSAESLEKPVADRQADDQRESGRADQSDDSSAQNDSQSPEEQMRDMEARREELQAAREFVEKTLLAERNLERQANPSQQARMPNLSQEQRKLNRSLQDYVEKHSPSFCRSQGECSGAQSAMAGAAESLARKDRNARQQIGTAAEALQELDDSLERKQQLDNLADAYRLRRMLDQQMAQLGECRQHGLSRQQGERLGEQIRRTTEQLKQIATNTDTREFFGDKLREALSNPNMEATAGQCQQLGQSSNSSGQKKAAGELARTLQQLARAFDASCPDGADQGGRGDGLLPNGQEAIARGVRQLESAARRGNAGRSLSARDRARLTQDAQDNLGIGISSLYGDDPRSAQVLHQLQQKLERPEYLIDMQTIRDLLGQIQQLGRDSAAVERPNEQPGKTTNVDLSKLPPAYRRSIEKYFEKLSEQ